jgi:hypothetical protein
MKIETTTESAGEWHWLVDVERYDRDPRLSQAETSHSWATPSVSILYIWVVGIRPNDWPDYSDSRSWILWDVLWRYSVGLLVAQNVHGFHTRCANCRYQRSHCRDGKHNQNYA